jgi:hypothetical protein
VRSLRGTALALQHVRAHPLVDRREMAVQELLGVVRRRRDVRPLAELQHRLLRRRPVAAGADDHDPLLLGHVEPRPGQDLRDGVRQPRHIFAAQSRQSGDRARVASRVAPAPLDLGSSDDDLLAELPERAVRLPRH